METHAALLQRLDEIRSAIKGLADGDFASRYHLDSAADRLRSALARLDDGGEMRAEWEQQAVRALEETELAVPTVNIDTRKEPGL